MAPPIPNATARPVRIPGSGHAIAYPAPASGDLWDDSGVVVDFMEGSSVKAHVRATVGLPDRVSAAALADGAVAIAYTLAAGNADGSLFRLAIVRADQSVIGLPSPQAGYDTLGWGPKLISMDDGFIAAWTSAPQESPGYVVTLHIAAWDTDGSQGASVEQVFPGMPPSETFDVAYSKEDRSLHAVWSPVWGSPDPMDRVLHQRWVCGPGIK